MLGDIQFRIVYSESKQMCVKGDSFFVRTGLMYIHTDTQALSM